MTRKRINKGGTRTEKNLKTIQTTYVPSTSRNWYLSSTFGWSRRSLRPNNGIFFHQQVWPESKKENYSLGLAYHLTHFMLTLPQLKMIQHCEWASFHDWTSHISHKQTFFWILKLLTKNLTANRTCHNSAYKPVFE